MSQHMPKPLPISYCQAWRDIYPELPCPYHQGLCPTTLEEIQEVFGAPWREKWEQEVRTAIGYRTLLAKVEGKSDKVKGNWTLESLGGV